MWANFGEPSVCTFKTSPCVRSKRPCVYQHHAHMCYHMCAWCRYTRGRSERTHGFFPVCHTTHTPHAPQHTRTTHTTTHTTSTQNNTQQHTETDRQTDRDRKQGKVRRGTREDKIEDKRRDEKRQDEREQNRDTIVVVWFFLFVCSKLPDPRIISNFQNYHSHSESIFIFPVTFCL